MFCALQWWNHLFMGSCFQIHFYPATATENPAPNMINVPLAAGSDGTAARKVLEQRWLPALDAFQPQMILISAGFDAHRDDLLGGLALVETDYEWMTRELMALAGRHSQRRTI